MGSGCSFSASSRAAARAACRGVGYFDASKWQSYRYNLKDPVYRNTMFVLEKTWTAVRFKADNPGIWILHCESMLRGAWRNVPCPSRPSFGNGTRCQLFAKPCLLEECWLIFLET